MPPALLTTRPSPSAKATTGCRSAATPLAGVSLCSYLPRGLGGVESGGEIATSGEIVSASVFSISDGEACPAATAFELPEVVPSLVVSSDQDVLVSFAREALRSRWRRFWNQTWTCIQARWTMRQGRGSANPWRRDAWWETGI